MTAYASAAEDAAWEAGKSMVPPPLAIRPELTQDDIDWLNSQLAIAGRPSVTYARALPRPPVWVRYSA